MKNQQLLVVFLLFFYVHLNGQDNMLSAFRITNVEEEHLFFVKNIRQNEEINLLTIPSKDILNYPKINFHSSYLYSGIESLSTIDIKDIDLKKASIFTVFHPMNSGEEKLVWCFGTESEGRQILTTHRNANLYNGKYLNHDALYNIDLPQLNSFVQNNSNGDYTRFCLGQKPSVPELPISNFTGMIPEILIFDRILGRTERQKVETYLAIKYGIPINQTIPTDYTDSSGETIWDSKENKAYPFFQTGIGRDDFYGLNQKQATNSYDPNLLTISLGDLKSTNVHNDKNITNGNFLIWSDNGLEVNYADDNLGFYETLNRQWIMNKTGAQADLYTNIYFDVERIENEVDRDKKYWLLIDRDAKGKPSIENVEVVSGIGTRSLL